MAEGRKQKEKGQTVSVKINTYLQVTALIVISGCWSPEQKDTSKNATEESNNELTFCIPALDSS